MCKSGSCTGHSAAFQSPTWVGCQAHGSTTCKVHAAAALNVGVPVAPSQLQHRRHDGLQRRCRLK